MKDRRDDPMTKEQRRKEQLRYIMEHWDELPETCSAGLKGRFRRHGIFLCRKRTDSGPAHLQPRGRNMNEGR